MVQRHLSHSLKLGISPRIIKKGIYGTRKTVTSLIACNRGIRTNSVRESFVLFAGYSEIGNCFTCLDFR